MILMFSDSYRMVHVTRTILLLYLSNSCYIAGKAQQQLIIFASCYVCETALYGEQYFCFSTARTARIYT